MPNLAKLLVTAVSALCLAGAAKNVADVTEAHVSKYGALSDWNEAQLGEFLTEQKVSPDTIALLHREHIDGGVLLHLSDDDLKAAGVPTGDRLRIHKIIEALQVTPHHVRDIEDVMNLNRGNFHLLFTLAGASPFAGVLATRYYQEGIDAAFWGKGSTTNANFTWTKAFLAPNVVLWEYIRHFYDTNPIITTCIGITMLLAQLAHWASLAAAVAALCSKTPKDGAKKLLNLFVTVPIQALVGSLFFRYIVFPITPRFLTNWLFYGGVVFGPMVQVSILLTAVAAIGAVFGMGVGAVVGAEAATAALVQDEQLYRQKQAMYRTLEQPDDSEDPNNIRKLH